MKMPPQHEGIIHDVYQRPGKQYLWGSLELYIQVDRKIQYKGIYLNRKTWDKYLK